jgi:8-oxo-dGTP pyrophosphatase MutT (NUDIX family)
MREHSAGGVVLRHTAEGLWVAAIVPQGRAEGHWVLPKGLVEKGEAAVDGAVREVREETGLRAEPVQRLDSSRYVYQRGGNRIFKVVDWWLMRAVGGTIGAITEAMRVEVADAGWLRADEVIKALAYQGERATVRAALEIAGAGHAFEEE